MKGHMIMTFAGPLEVDLSYVMNNGGHQGISMEFFAILATPDPPARGLWENRPL
jgi:hypothetical protein